MTICVAVKVQDCIVFAADSTSSLQAFDQDGKPVVVNTYDHANKLYNLRKGLPLAAMTAGIGNFGASSISTISKDFRVLLGDSSSPYFIDSDSYTVADVAAKARKFLFEERFSSLTSKPQGSFQYWIGGYSAGKDLGEIWRIEIKDGVCGDPVCEAEQDSPCHIGWGGAPEAVNRLVLGYGGQIGRALEASGVPETKIRDAITQISRFTQAQLVHPAMPTSDAIDLARFLAETTKSFVRFSPGSNSVGGNVDIATVTKHEKFKWVERKHFYSPTLNPLETDHA